MHLIFLLSLPKAEIFTLKTWYFYNIRSYSYCSRLINDTTCFCKSLITVCLIYISALQVNIFYKFYYWRTKIIKSALPAVLQLSTLSPLLVEYCNKLPATIFWRQNRNHIGQTILSQVCFSCPSFATCVDPTTRSNWKVLHLTIMPWKNPTFSNTVPSIRTWTFHPFLPTPSTKCEIRS